MPMTALLVHGPAEDFAELRRRLEAWGLCVSEADSGIRALALAELDSPELVIVEDPLPDMSGPELCRRIGKLCGAPTLLVGADDARETSGPGRAARNRSPRTPRCDDVAARAAGLIAAKDADAAPDAVRRGRMLVLGDLTLDLQTNRATVGVREMKLAPTQVNLLRVLMERSPRVTSPEALIERVWPRGGHDQSALADVIMTLRVALEDEPADPRRLVYIPDYGYRLERVAPASGPRTVSHN